MGSFLWSQLRLRRHRAALLGVAILVAAVSFTLLTSVVSTSSLQVKGTVAQNWRTAYDILVRPPSSFTALEREQGLVRENYLSGIFGGITMAQYREVRQLPGVEVAAPIANVGYIFPLQLVRIRVNEFLNDDPVQIYRLNVARVANSGTSTYPDTELYVYYTRRHRLVRVEDEPAERIPGNPEPVRVCDGLRRSTPPSFGPFSSRNSISIRCFSERTPTATRWGQYDMAPGSVGSITQVYFPILVAAIDPRAEARLLGIDRALVSGRYLTDADRPEVVSNQPVPGSVRSRSVPVIAAARTFIDEELSITVERLKAPSGTSVPEILASTDAYRFLTRLDGQTVGEVRSPIAEAYAHLLRSGEDMPGIFSPGSWSVSSVSYSVSPSGILNALPVSNPRSVWQSPYYPENGGFLPAPPENQDVQFRGLSPHAASNQIVGNISNTPAFHVVGRFDPDLLPGFSPLSRVPLETYYPPQVTPADPASRRALGDSPLRPTANLGDYIAQPPLMLTNLRSLGVLTNPQFFEGADPSAPISVIRVRVSGATGPDPVSRERVRRVAQAIHEQTGLAVDITAGSSPTPMLIHLPAGEFGRPALTVQEGWVTKGVAVVILTAIDSKSLALFLLVLVVSGFFLANGALASVRARRTEIGTLLCIGWPRARIYQAILGELALIGLVSGLVGTLVALGLVGVLGFQMSASRALLVTPIAVLLASVAGLLPAWRAARSIPLDAIRPPVTDRFSARNVSRMWILAFTNLRRLPGRTLLGMAALFVSVAAMAALLSINLAFQGLLSNSLLGTFISLQVRGVDYLSIGLAVAVGALSVADVLFLNVRERGAELATLLASGWTKRNVARLVVLEGIILGFIGSTAGAVAGVGLAALLGGPALRMILTGLLAVALAVALVALASLVPARLVGRMAPTVLLAEE